jgi:NADPH-dependent curcumin reductase CurA
MIFKKRLQIHGLFVGDHAPALAPRFFAEVPALMARGKMIGREALTKGLESAPVAFFKLLQEGGADELGKPVVVVAEE